MPSQKRKETFIFNYIKKVFLAIEPVYDDKSIENKVYNFYLASLIIFIFFFLFIFKYNYLIYSFSYAFSISLLPAFILAIIPFSILTIRLYKTQRQSSYEATLIISELLNQYKIHNCNIVEAIDASIINLDERVICRRFLLRLSIGLKEYKTDEELMRILDEFSFSVNTNWIRMLSDMIFFALANNINVAIGLEGILEQIKTIDKTQNIGKRLNNEGFMMAKYFAPVLYIAMLIISVRVVGIKLEDLFYAQFTGIGLSYFIIMIILFIVCYICEYFYKKRKFDF